MSSLTCCTELYPGARCVWTGSGACRFPRTQPGPTTDDNHSSSAHYSDNESYYFIDELSLAQTSHNYTQSTDEGHTLMDTDLSEPHVRRHDLLSFILKANK